MDNKAFTFVKEFLITFNPHLKSLHLTITEVAWD